VPGLAAKPIIDLMAATGDLDGVGAREGDLHLLGYGFHHTGMPGRLLYRRGPASARAHHLHVVQASTLPTRNRVLLGDYLRGHPDDAARYGALKRRLAALHDNGGDYTGARTELIRELTDKARAERGLPPAPV
jgi:GrpB-like predicted nucleotidyltransferase (UPF0157 family)